MMSFLNDIFINKLHNKKENTWNGVLDGGFGEKIARFYSSSNMKVLNLGAKKEFTDRVPLQELYQRYHLTEELIVSDIMNIIKWINFIHRWFWLWY